MKETLELETVEKYFENLRWTIIDLIICIDNIQAIADAKNNKVNLYPIYLFVRHYIYLCYSKASITIYKLFKPEEKSSFQKFFNKFKNFRYGENLKNQLFKNSESGENYLLKSKDELLATIEVIEKQIEDKAALLSKINLRRIKLYAHSEPNFETEPETLAELKEIKELAVSVYNNIYGKLLDREFMFDVPDAYVQSVLNDRIFVDQYWARLELENEKKR